VLSNKSVVFLGPVRPTAAGTFSGPLFQGPSPNMFPYGNRSFGSYPLDFQTQRISTENFSHLCVAATAPFSNSLAELLVLPCCRHIVFPIREISNRRLRYYNQSIECAANNAEAPRDSGVSLVLKHFLPAFYILSPSPVMQGAEQLI